LKTMLKKCSSQAPQLQHVAGSDVIAYVKSDAYGHGLAGVAQTLSSTGCAYFAVASINELIAIRQVNQTARVLVSSSYYAPENLEIIAQYRGDIVVFHEEAVTLLENCSLSSPLSVWLKVNTGMNRMGISPDRFSAILKRLHACRNVAHDALIVMTHFASADDINSPQTAEQIERFDALTAGLPFRRSAANSSAILHFPHSYYDIVRPGLLLYGVSPIEAAHPLTQTLTPVMTVSSRVIAINHVPIGGQVGYKATWTATRPTITAVIAFGYGDGYPLNVKPPVSVVIDGKRCPLIGRISMDTMVADITDCATVTIGSHVELWGEQIPVSEVAEAADTIPYEILTHISTKRADRVDDKGESYVY
jgi:alanine racemase